MDPNFGLGGTGLPFPMPSAFAAFPPTGAGAAAAHVHAHAHAAAAAAAAATGSAQGTMDARYFWDPAGRSLHPAAFQHPGLGGTPTGAGPSLQELTFLAAARRSVGSGGGGGGGAGPHGAPPGGHVGGVPVSVSHDLHPAYRLNPYVEHLYGSLHSSPTASLRGLSPLDPRGLAFHADYMANMSALSSRALGDLHHSQSLLGSTDVPFSIDGMEVGSRLASPRPGGPGGGVGGSIRQSRKRALSSSPYSDSFDLSSMIRFSPTSLVSIMNGSRSSSTSGSYSHLSAGALSPALGLPSLPAAHLQQLQAHLIRTGSLGSSLGGAGSPFLPPGMLHQGNVQHPHAGLFSLHNPMGLSLGHMPGMSMKHEMEYGKSKESPNPVSSTVEHEETVKVVKSRVKKEPATSSCSGGGHIGVVRDSSADLDEDAHDGSGDPMKDEPGDFIETNCHWKECSKEFLTQDELVKHINNDHIHANKKSFVCRWRECSREEKPFKAQYMLVVHMRRHTGEKPHRCTFEGCTKAYSRLENLKTHLRSHTGEKPYMCEFPGCSKAFSNASDRAKHQNRTHSNEKPYVCKAPGCTKRYTDPSSLRKHVKTVHGADFYANKKHKGGNGGDGPGPGPGPSPGGLGMGSSPRSDDGGTKTASVSSPSVKSEDAASPGQLGSPGTESSMTPGGMGGGGAADDPVSDNVVSTTQLPETETEWAAEEVDEIDIPGLSVSVSVSVSNDPHGSPGQGFHVQDSNSRNRLKSRLQAKGGPSLPPLPNLQGSRRGMGITDLNQRITDLRMTNNSTGTSHLAPQTNTSNNRTRLVEPPTVLQGDNRRDSNSTTVSSYYGSMRSGTSPLPGSRRSSETSQFSSVSGRAAVPASPFVDPISPGSSRRSSDTSGFHGGSLVGPMSNPVPQYNAQGNATGVVNSAGPPMTATMAAQLQKMQRRAMIAQNMNPAMLQNQNMGMMSNNTSAGQNWSQYYCNMNSTPAPGYQRTSQTPGVAMGSVSNTNPHHQREVRRASDPVRTSTESNMHSANPLPRHHSYSNLNQFHPNQNHGRRHGQQFHQQNSQNVPLRHPNEGVALDEVGEGQNLEDKLVIPDEMLQYLNQVAIQETPVASPRALSVCMSPRPDSASTIVNQPLTQQQLQAHRQPQGGVMSPPAHNMYNPQSPASLYNQSMTSPSSVYNQAVPSPGVASHFNQLQVTSPIPPNRFNQSVQSPAAATPAPTFIPNNTNVHGINYPVPAQNRSVHTTANFCNYSQNLQPSMPCQNPPHNQGQFGPVNCNMYYNPNQSFVNPNPMMNSYNHCSNPPQQQPQQQQHMYNPHNCHNCGPHQGNNNLCSMPNNQGGSWNNYPAQIPSTNVYMQHYNGLVAQGMAMAPPFQQQQQQMPIMPQAMGMQSGVPQQSQTNLVREANPPYTHLPAPPYPDRSALQVADVSQSQSQPNPLVAVPNPEANMRPDAYQRTLEYVQQCQTWNASNPQPTGPQVLPGNEMAGVAVTTPASDVVSSTTEVAGKMGASTVNHDMTKTGMVGPDLNSVLDENRFLQMI